jgi:hypothetical protein
MIKVKNDRVVLTLSKKGKVIKKLDFTNRLTDLYLDYVLSKHIGVDYVTDDDNVEVFFSYAYLKFDDTQTITDASTTMDYDVKSEALTPNDITIKVGESNKKMTIDYAFDLSSIPSGSTFTGIGFGRDDSANTDYLLSFIDLSGTGLETVDDVSIGVSRIDEISSNEITTTGEYLPFYATASDNYGELKSISLVYEGDYKSTYLLSDLDLDRISAGYLRITNIPNYQDTTGLYPSDSLYPAGEWVTAGTGADFGFAIGQVYEEFLYSIGSEAGWYDTLEAGNWVRGTNDGKYHYFYLIEDELDQYFTASSFAIYPTITVAGFFKDAEKLVSPVLPTNEGPPLKMEFYYEGIGTTYTTYIPIQDLDIGFNDTSMYLNIKIERGDY